jgi:hypothetical protein
VCGFDGAWGLVRGCAGTRRGWESLVGIIGVEFEVVIGMVLLSIWMEMEVSGMVLAVSVLAVLRCHSVPLSGCVCGCDQVIGSTSQLARAEGILTRCNGMH